MLNRLFRFGTWFATLSLALSSLISPITPLAHAAEPDPNFTTQALTGSVVINEFTSFASGTQGEFIELSNPTSSTADLSGWTLSTKNGVITTFAPGTTVAAGAFNVTSYVGMLSDTDDTLTLKNASSTQIDQIRYGTGLTAQLRAPAQGKSAGRRPNGDTAWFTNLAPTPGATNGSSLTLQPPSATFVAAGTSNTQNVINRFNQAATVVQMNLLNTSVSTDMLTVDLIDSAGTLKTTNVAGTNGAGSVTTARVDTTAAPALIDGSITLRSYATDASGISTAYGSGNIVATRDTVAPAGPSSAFVPATPASGQNLMNQASVHSVSVQVTLPSSAQATDSLRVDLTSGTTASKTVSALAGGGAVTVTGIDASTISDGQVTISATLIDAAGNSSATFTGTSATKDTAAPDGTVMINGGATVTTSSNVILSISASDVGTGVTLMRLANTNNFIGTSFEPIATTKTWSLIAGEGLRTVYVQFMDAAGNISPARNVLSTNEALILVKTDAQQITVTPVATGTQTVKQLPAEATVTATSPTTITFANYLTNPGTSLPDGLTSTGRYVEIGTADPSKLTFPVLVRLYYTQADLTAAGITSKNQLKGISFFDEQARVWKMYDSTGVSTADITVDGQQFAGFLYANADHLTPMTGLADIVAPAAPDTLTVMTSSATAELSWPAVSDAASYVVRYRRTGTTTFTTVTLTGDITSTKITNLKNGTSYEFGVASRDSAGNTSDFTTTTAMLPTIEPAPLTQTPLVMGTGSANPTVGGTSKSKTKATTSPSATPTPTVTSSTPSAEQQSEDRARSTSRFLVILAIIVIIVGAGAAGFYGYQWWTAAPGAKPTPPPVTKPPTPTPRPPQSPPPAPPAQPASAPPAPTEPKPPTDQPKPPTGRW